MDNLKLNNGTVATFVGYDDWSRPLYKLENGITVVSTEFDGSHLHSRTTDWGEPISPLKDEWQPSPDNF